MKVLIVLVFILSFVWSVEAQADCETVNKVFVRDSEGKILQNAKLEVFEIRKYNKIFLAFYPNKIENDAYLFISVNGGFRSVDKRIHTVGENYLLKVSAQGFETVEQKIKFYNCKSLNLEVKLRKSILGTLTGIITDAQSVILTGTVYDQQGAIIPNAAVKVKAKSGKQYEIKADDNGDYEVEITKGIYAIEYSSSNFKPLRIKNTLCRYHTKERFFWMLL